MEDEAQQQEPPPSRYRWVVLVASFLTMFTTGSMSYISGVIHVGLLEAFPETSVSLIVLIGSIFLCMFGPSGPVASAVISLSSCRTCVVISGVAALVGFSSNFLIYNPWWMVLTYGIIAGSCVGLSVVGSLVCLGYYFKGNIGMASGVAMCGQALGMFVHPPLQHYMAETYGVRGAFLLTGGIAAHSCVFGLLMVPNKLERTRNMKQLSGKTSQRRIAGALCGDCMNYGSIVQYRSFVYLLLGAVAFGMGTSTECLYIPDFFQSYSSKQTASFSLSFSGIGSLISRFAIGLIANDENIGSGLLYSCTNGIMGIVSLFVLYFTESTAGILLYGLLLGLYTGGNWSLMAPMSIEILDLDLSSTGLGLLMLAYGTGYLTGPPMSNAVFGVTGQYYHVFLFAASMFMISCVCGCISTITRKPSKLSWNRNIIEQKRDKEKDLNQSDVLKKYDKNDTTYVNELKPFIVDDQQKRDDVKYGNEEDCDINNRNSQDNDQTPSIYQTLDGLKYLDLKNEGNVSSNQSIVRPGNSSIKTESVECFIQGN